MTHPTGKGYTLRWMSAHGYFPLEDIVHIDPDHFKKLMPEWQGYLARSQNAGDLTHRESGYLQEIAQEVALGASQNIWVDGSLKDGAWFADVFRDIRRRFPKYKLAIFHVSAPEDAVRERVKKRAAASGRTIPEDLIQASLRSVGDALEQLTPLVDFIAQLSNTRSTPELLSFVKVDSSGDWGVIKKQFVHNMCDR